MTNQRYLFFVVFSRFEYALKASGFLRRDKNGDRAEPGWRDFRNSLEGILEERFRDDILEAVKLLIANNTKPRVQKVFDRMPVYEAEELDGHTDFQRAIEATKRVRNNLFHGGKAGELGTEVERSAELIGASLSVLKLCMCELSRSDNERHREVHTKFTELGILPDVGAESDMVDDWLDTKTC